MTPEISVIMPVYNAEAYVEASVRSIINQTFNNWELVIVNDGSIDRSEEKIKQFLTDNRIKFFSTENRGVANALNLALDYCTGKYIARQDADDVSHADRFAKLYKLLEDNPSIGLAGGGAEVVDINGKTKDYLLHPLSNAMLQYQLLWDSAFVSSTVLFRRDCINICGYFYTKPDCFEDYNMWSKIARHYKIANLKDILLIYRELSTGLSNTTTNSVDRIRQQRRLNLSFYFPELTGEEVEALANSGFSRSPVSSVREIKRVQKIILKWFEELGPTPEEVSVIRSDLYKRLQCMQFLSSSSTSFLKNVERAFEKIIYKINIGG